MSKKRHNLDHSHNTQMQGKKIPRVEAKGRLIFEQNGAGVFLLILLDGVLLLRYRSCYLMHPVLFCIALCHEKTQIFALEV